MKRLFTLGLVFALNVPASAFALSQDLQLTVRTLQVNSSVAARGAQRIPMFALEFTASCRENVTVSSVALTHQGLGDSDDFLRIYAMEDGKRITRTSRFSSKGIGNVRLRNFVVTACATRTIMIYGDLAPDAMAGGEHHVTLESSKAIEADAPVELILSGTSHSVETAPVSNGIIDISYLPVRGKVRYGPNRIIGRIMLEADNNDDHLINAITFTNDGKARDKDLQNLYIESSDGMRLSKTLPSLDEDTIRFVFDPPLLLERNRTRTLELHADIRASSKKTIKMEIEEPGDLEAVQKQRGVRFQ
jgi:hypothetical protein